MIDYKELDPKNSGTKLQQMARQLGQRMDLHPYYCGPGPDDGVDLYFYDRVKSPVSSWQVKWLVQCKDYSTSGKSVSQSDVGCVYDKVLQHECQGYLLITTTDMTSGLSKLLDSLHTRNRGPILTECWNSATLNEILVIERFVPVLRQFMPNSYDALKKAGRVP